MPPPDRPRPFDERDDYDDLPRRPRANPGLIVALAVGGAFALGCVVCGGIGLFGFWAAPVQMVQVQAPPVAQGEGAMKPKPDDVMGKGKEARQVYTRDEFRQLVVGKTPDEVIAAVGRPDETTEDGAATRWTYRDRVRAGPGKGTASPVVVFRDGKAAEVTY